MSDGVHDHALVWLQEHAHALVHVGPAVVRRSLLSRILYVKNLLVPANPLPAKPLLSLSQLGVCSTRRHAPYPPAPAPASRGRHWW